MTADAYRVRASSWGSLFDCAFRWEGVNLLGITSPSSPRALLGTAIHASTAEFDAARVSGILERLRRRSEVESGKAS